MSADFLKGQPSLNTDNVLNGRYEVGELIGRGGMADVYLGRDIRLGRSVAIKVLRPDLARDPLFQSRFRREAQAVAGLNHPAIVSVYDTGDQESAAAGPHDVRLPFIVMEYVPGRTLRDLLKSGEITPDKAIEYVQGVLSALEYSHRSGIVHRDIKPANVMVTADEQVKVMDFGIARAMADSAATMTQTQAVIGTAQYLSPEQARGESVDARSDLYSAACLLYELLTGRPPFTGDSPVSVAYQHVREQPEKPSRHNPRISARLDEVLMRGLAKDRRDRYQDASAFSAALSAARDGHDPAPETAATQAIAVSAPAAPRVTVPSHEAGTRALQTVPATDVPAQADAPGGQNDDNLSTALGVGSSDDRDPEQKARRRAWITTLLVTLLLLLAAGAFLLWSLVNSAPEEPRTAVVPIVETLPQTEAMNQVIEAGFGAPTVELLFSDTIAEGLAIGTSPSGGTDTALDNGIVLYISKGPSEVVIPADLGGMTESAARDELRSLGLLGGTSTTEANSATVAAGRVLATDPAAGTAVEVGTTVDLILSTGQVTVPDLVGLQLDRATAILADPSYLLGVAVVEIADDSVDPGTVLAQNYAAGTNVAQASTVTLTVAAAVPDPTPVPEDTPSPSPSVAATPSPTPSGGPAKPSPTPSPTKSDAVER